MMIMMLSAVVIECIVVPCMCSDVVFLFCIRDSAIMLLVCRMLVLIQLPD